MNYVYPSVRKKGKNYLNGEISTAKEHSRGSDL
jgi:hypothetical protein